MNIEMIEFKCEICNKIIKCNIDKKDWPTCCNENMTMLGFNNFRRR